MTELYRNAFWDARYFKIRMDTGPQKKRVRGVIFCAFPLESVSLRMAAERKMTVLEMGRRGFSNAW